MGRENAASEIQVVHSQWKAFWGPRTHHEKCCCYWSLDLTGMPFPTLYTPWYQLKWLPQLQGTELAWAETNPTQHNWFYDVQWGTVQLTLLQRKSAGIPSFFPSTAWKTLPGFVCGSQARHNSLLLSLVGIGLMPRWGQGAGPQSKCCGRYCRKFARCFLCPCPPTTRVPFECFLPHCAFFSMSYVPTETQAHTLLQPLCSSTALPGLDSTHKAVVSRFTTWQHRLNFQPTSMKVKAWALHPSPNLPKEPTEINKILMNCRLSAVNLPGNPPQQLIISVNSLCCTTVQFSFPKMN